MSEELENEVGEIEEVAELTPEEIFEQHQKEIAERFDEKGFFRRLGEMFSGLSKPRSSREYKLAVIDLKRLAAPLLAILLPTLGVIALIVITEVTGQSKDIIQIEVQKADDAQDDLTDEQEQEPEVEEIPPDEQIDITIDTPDVNPVMTPDTTPAPSNEPVSVKPATQDSVAIIKSPVTMKSMAGSRNPGMIGRMTSGGKGYGNAQTEAAVLKALRWLKKTQKEDGSWPYHNAIANTALAVLAYLAHGETPDSLEFGQTVRKAMEFLIGSQYVDKGGVVRFKGSDANEYAFLIATYALCETYGMTKNPNAKKAAMKALQRIVDNQSATGGWDYKINKASTRDDVSFAGWALQALKAGKMAGMHPDRLDECIKKAIKCLKTRNFRNGGFNYTAGGGATGLTATGCLAMQLLGYSSEKEVQSALEFMRQWKPAFDSQEKPKSGGPLPGHNPQYYCYYAAQCKYQAGMRQGATKTDEATWQEWNKAMIALYPKEQITLPEKIAGPDGKMHAMGYWKFKDPTCGGEKNTTMSTCLCALQLMVYYRYLPTTKLEATAVVDESALKTKDTVEVDVDI